jgi:hypothetical protein
MLTDHFTIANEFLVNKMKELGEVEAVEKLQ